MKSLLTILLLFYFHTSVFCQFGPGGIGNSTNNGLWLKASNYLGTSGDPVSVWKDTSGNNNDAVQLTSGRNPTYYSTSTLNGQPIIRLNGSNNELKVADADILDNSGGITFFTAIRLNNLNGSPRGILGKRISSGNTSNYAYTWFFWDANRMYVDLNTQNDRFNTSPTTFSNSTNYILSLEFDGSLTAANRVKIYDEQTLVGTKTETSTSITNSNQDLVIGALNSNYGTYLGADYAELIQYNFAVNTAQRIIINNYLSAQYNISLSANDVYKNDDPGNGNYDHEVAGIGRVDASNIHDDAQGSSEPRFLNPTNLNDGEFMLWGHNNATGNDYVDIPAVGIDGRMSRVWRVSERNTSGSVDVGTVDLRWDLSNGTPATAAHLRLIIDTDNDGIFADETPISGATSLGGNQFQFAGVTLIRDSIRFTLASTDTANTPLPVTWLNFSGTNNGSSNILKWSTSSEQNNDYFSIQRSEDGIKWNEIGKTSGKGNSTERSNYQYIDLSPKSVLNYYRLKQVDFNGDVDYSNTIAVSAEQIKPFSIYPNPANHTLTVSLHSKMGVSLMDLLGRTIEVPSSQTGTEIMFNTSSLKSGIYFVKVVNQNSNQTTVTKVIIQH